MTERTIAVAGGSGFIGRAIVRGLVKMPGIRLRVLTRKPESARRRLDLAQVEFITADVTEPKSLGRALAGVDSLVNATQFDGYPIEKPRRGLTFERVDYGGTVNLLEAAKLNAVRRLVYISGAAADENSTHPGFRAKGRAERAIRESGIEYTIFRPSLVYGPEDRVLNGIARLLRFAPVFVVPGTGRQKVQPVLVDNLAEAVALALGSLGSNQILEIGGPEAMTFDEMIKLVMQISGHHRPIVHAPETLMRAAGAIAESLPGPLFSRDAVTFVVADNACDVKPLIEQFGIRLTPAQVGMSYLKPTS